MRLPTLFARISLSLVLLVATAAAQTTPDFSGDWVMTSLDAGVDAPREIRVQITTVSGVQVMRVDRRGLSGSRSSEYRIGLEGGVMTGTQSMRLSARWVGQQLAIKEGWYQGPLGDGASFTEREESWSLDASGQLVIAASVRQRDAAPQTTRTTYRRR